jgi:hypothetical protein
LGDGSNASGAPEPVGERPPREAEVEARPPVPVGAGE